MVKEIQSKTMKQEISSKVLNDLPDWFGIPEYTKDYIQKSKEMPFFAKFVGDNPVGFVSLKETSSHTIEIFCMGILKQYHRLGYGKELFIAVQTYAVLKDYKFMQVKTVEQGKYDMYDRTNAFYRSLGFYELEVLPKLWDEWNPCQIFVKSL